MVVVVGCKNCKISVLDSAVVTSRTIRCVDCEHCEFVIEDVDIRKVRF